MGCTSSNSNHQKYNSKCAPFRSWNQKDCLAITDSLFIYVLTASLQVKHDFTFDPEFFEAVEFATVGGEEVHNYATIIGQHPASFGVALDTRADIVLGAHLSLHGARQGIEHAIARARTDNKIIRDRGNFADIQQQNILALLLLENVDDRMGNF